MAFDETLADRIREGLASRRDVREVKMMGGLCFMVGGHMAIGIVGDELMVRVGPDGYERALALVPAMDFYKCSFCEFRDPCQARLRQLDEDAILQEKFNRRGSAKKEVA